MYDIHTHILPYIDDGAESMSDALMMLRGAVNGGTHGLVCTPHCCIPNQNENLYDDTLQQRFDRLCSLCADEGLPLKLFLGQEVFLSGPVPAYLSAGKLITVNHSRYLLCEFHPNEDSNLAIRKLQKLISDGYTPIVAHPERYHFIAENPTTAERMKAIGAVLQLDAGCLSGLFGPQAAQIARRLLHSRLADCIASDAHSPYIRCADLSDEHEQISERYSFDYAQLLLSDNPRRIIENKPLLSD